MNINSLMQASQKITRTYYEMESALSLAEREQVEVKEAYERHVQNLELFEKSRIFLQELAEATRKQIVSGLEQIVSLCLQSVYGPDIRFEIEIKTSRNNTSLFMYVVDTSGDEVIQFAPEDSMGGGVVDVCAIGLRFGLLKILTPAPAGPIILDEPAKMVSSDLMDAIARLLQELQQIFGKQIILATHHDSVKAVVDHTVRIQRTNGISKVVS